MFLKPVFSRVRLRLIPLALAFGLFAGLPAFAQEPGGETSPEIIVTLLQLNDVYQPEPVDKGARGGLARVSTLRAQIEAKNPNTIFVLGGDTLSPSGPAGVFEGKHMIEAWNAAGLDVAVLGNHEFDYGDAVLKQRIAESEFPWLGANVYEGERLFPGVLPYVIKEIDGVKIGFFGLLTPDTKGASHPGPNVRFTDPIYKACETVSELYDKGAEVIVAVTHLTMQDDKRLARQVPVAVIMGGHEHALLQSFARSTPIFKVGSDARTLGKLDLHIDRASHRLTSLDWELIPVTADIPDDPAVVAVTKPYADQLEASLGQVIGKTTVELDAIQAHNRAVETNLGNLIADGFRERMGAQAAVLNGGSIRSNTTYGPGDLTRKDVYSIQPFKGKLVKVSLKGAILKQALEHAVGRLEDEEAGRFLQVSGLKFTYDGRKPAGSRVTQVMIANAPLKETADYTLAVTTYLLEGGDDFTMFRGNYKLLTDEQEAPLDQDVLLSHIEKLKTVAPKTEGRITRLDGKGI